jgi:multidrug resistance efflux pump
VSRAKAFERLGLTRIFLGRVWQRALISPDRESEAHVGYIATVLPGAEAPVAIAKTVEQAKAAEAEAQHNVEEVKRDHFADIYSDLNQRVTSESELKGNFDKSRELYALKWLRAPVSGIVQKIDVTTIGQVVTPAHRW